MNFLFCQANADYCDFLRESDPCVPYTMDKKSTRPFVGIVFSVNNYNYYAPLTSPKQKHLTMKNQVDFLKINNGVWGAINFNNMIPIHKNSLHLINVNILPSDDKATIAYKNLLTNQLLWCDKTENAAVIMKQAKNLYTLITEQRAWPQLKNRCCNFSIDEKQYRIYCQKHNFIMSNNIYISEPAEPDPAPAPERSYEDKSDDLGRER